MAEIIKLVEHGQAHAVLSEVLELLEKGRLRNFCIAYEWDDPEDKNTLVGTFFAGKDRVTILLGLLSRLMHNMQTYLDGETL